MRKEIKIKINTIQELFKFKSWDTSCSPLIISRLGVHQESNEHKCRLQFADALPQIVILKHKTWIWPKYCCCCALLISMLLIWWCWWWVDKNVSNDVDNKIVTKSIVWVRRASGNVFMSKNPLKSCVEFFIHVFCFGKAYESAADVSAVQRYSFVWGRFRGTDQHFETKLNKKSTTSNSCTETLWSGLVATYPSRLHLAEVSF